MSWTDENSVLKDLKLFLIFKIPEQPLEVTLRHHWTSVLWITVFEYKESSIHVSDVTY